MWKLIFITTIFVVQATEQQSIKPEWACTGRPHYNVSLTAYYPDFNSDLETDYLDMRGKKLRTLQDFIDDRADYVTVSMDTIPQLRYGSIVCVPELNKHFGRLIPLQVRDHGVNLRSKGYSRLDICVRTESDSYDNAVNRLVTLYTKN